MKGIFKHIFVMMSMLAMTIGFVGCNDDDDNDDNPSSIVGTWVYEEYDGDEDYIFYEFTFKSNGTCILELELYEHGDTYSTTLRGTYEVDKDELIIEVEGEILIFIIGSITSDKLVLYEEDGDDRMIFYKD